MNRNISDPPDRPLPADKIALFNQSPFARLLGMEITEARPGWARVAMDPGGKGNPNQKLHGGAIFALADQAFGIAANMEDPPEVAVSASIMYLAPAEGRLEAVAERVGEDDRHSFYRVTVYEGKRMVATFEGTGVKTPPGAGVKREKGSGITRGT
ncbi:MAG: PaaI family thioesterase [Methanomicrobiales archaeon]|nr:PaaI family thioesterase [Methanomicrobiales archaeon]